METVTATEFARNVGKTLDRVARNREEVVIERHGEPIARIVPIQAASSQPVPMDTLAFLKSLQGTLTAEEAEAFKADIAAAFPDTVDEWKRSWES
jgi:prevent-host-death family protein